jgi:hypothetical protein
MSLTLANVFNPINLERGLLKNYLAAPLGLELSTEVALDFICPWQMFWSYSMPLKTCTFIYSYLLGEICLSRAGEKRYRV